MPLFSPAWRSSSALFSSISFSRWPAAKEITFIIFSGVAQASILDMVLGGILKGTLILMKKTMLVHTGLTMFFPGLDFRSLPFIVLSQFDFFSLWYLAALALGIAAFAKISPKKSISVIVAVFPFQEPGFYRLFVLSP